MGWTGVHDRTQYVAEFMQGWHNDAAAVTVRKHHRQGEEDWFILDVLHRGGSRESLITLLVWDGGYVKHMDESAGPYFYGCPVEWFDEVPPPHSPYPWRQRLQAAQASTQAPRGWGSVTA